MKPQVYKMDEVTRSKFEKALRKLSSETFWITEDEVDTIRDNLYAYVYMIKKNHKSGEIKQSTGNENP